MPTILLNKIKPGGKTLTNLRVGSTEVKYVKRGDGKLFYDTLSYYSYGNPSVSLSYPSGNTPYSGGTKSPTLAYSQSKTPVGHSGTSYTASTLNSGASSIKYEVTSGAATVNASTGVVTWGTSTSTSARSATIKVTVTINSKSNSATATVTQAANSSTTTEYENPVIESVTASDVPASGGTTSNSYYTVKFYQRQRTKYADGTYSAWSYKYASGTVASTSNIIASTTLTGSNLETTAKSRTKLGTVTIQIKVNNKTSSGKNVNVYQQANQGTTITTEIKPTLSYAGMSSKTGQTSTPTVGYTWKYYISYTSGKDTNVSTVNSPNGPGISAMSPNYTLSDTTYFSINSSTGVVTTKSANTSTTADRTATVTLKLTFGGKTGQTTATVIQSKKASSYSQAWKFSVFNVTNTIYSFGFKFTNSAGNQFTLGGGGGSGGTSNPSRVGTSSIRSDISTSLFRPNGFYLTNMNSTYSSANNSSGYYQDGSTGKYYYVRWAYNKAPTTSNYKTHGYKFYSGIVESWTYSAGTLYVWAYQA